MVTSALAAGWLLSLIVKVVVLLGSLMVEGTGVETVMPAVSLSVTVKVTSAGLVPLVPLYKVSPVAGDGTRL